MGFLGDSLASKLKDFRKEKDESQSWLAKLIGLTRVTVTRWETKGADSATLAQVEMISKHLKIPVEELLGFKKAELNQEPSYAYITTDSEAFVLKTIEELNSEIRRDTALLVQWKVKREDLKASRGDLLAKEVNRDIQKLDRVIDQLTHTTEVRKKLLSELTEMPNFLSESKKACPNENENLRKKNA